MRIISDADEVRQTYHWLKKAAKEAVKSTCKKSQRGVVIVKDDKIIGAGHNIVTIKEHCNPCIREEIKDNGRIELCSAMHAEQMALFNAFNRGHRIDNSVLYHIKVKDGQMRESNAPSCTMCSRIMHALNILGILDMRIVLWQKKEGYVMYHPDEFNRISFEYFLKE